MEAILNELSVFPAPGTAIESRMTQLVRALRKLLEHGWSRVLRATRQVLDQPIDEGLTLRQWLCSRVGNREEKQFLKNILGKAPYVDDFEAEIETQKLALVECRSGNDIARGFGIAHHHDVPALSLPGKVEYDAPTVEVELLSISEAGEEMQRVAVIHIVTPEHVVHHRLWLQERLKRAVNTGAQLWDRRQTLFPMLDFCAHVERQLRALSGNEPFFAEIVRHLHVLSRTASEWTAGGFDPKPLRWSPESKQTMNVPAYAEARRFLCPDGVFREFSLHSKISCQTKRVFFEPNTETRRVLIGHVGQHLSTVLYP